MFQHSGWSAGWLPRKDIRTGDIGKMEKSLQNCNTIFRKWWLAKRNYGVRIQSARCYNLTVIVNRLIPLEIVCGFILRSLCWMQTVWELLLMFGWYLYPLVFERGDPNGLPKLIYTLKTWLVLLIDRVASDGIEWHSHTLCHVQIHTYTLAWHGTKHQLQT